MSGIYIHIPFCKQACSYCNFHFSTNLQLKTQLVNAICKELEIQKSFFEKEEIKTIYFGGGTPSMLTERELTQIFNTIFKHYQISNVDEVTLEANPDDLNENYLHFLKQTPINRLSIGIQSFFDADLQFMNRSHNAQQAQTVIENAQNTGFNNLTIDLIYGTPTMSNQRWLKNLEKAISLNINHISSYALTVEPKTALDYKIQKGKITPLNDEQAAEQFNILVETLTSVGFEHYEISNFAKSGFQAVHNTNYWKGKKYLGVGAAAHSFTGNTRFWNIANNIKYIKSIEAGNLPNEIEELSTIDQFNEMLMIGLRTKWGVNLNDIEQKFGNTYSNHIKKTSQTFTKSGLLKYSKENLTLTQKGKFIADSIIADLFLTD